MGKQAKLKKCLVCGKAVYATKSACVRCGSAVHMRKKHSLKKTTVFLIAALLLYIPANILPMFIFNKFGIVTTNTIFGGILLLIQEGMYGIALIIFCASILIPAFKIIGLSLLVLTIKYNLYVCTRKYIFLYLLINTIGRWSMVDLFVISVMLTLIHFSHFISVTIGWGTSAFCCVVILTMLAVNSFDSRLLWDAAEKQTNKQINK